MEGVVRSLLQAVGVFHRPAIEVSCGDKYVTTVGQGVEGNVQPRCSRGGRHALLNRTSRARVKRVGNCEGCQHGRDPISVRVV